MSKQKEKCGMLKIIEKDGLIPEMLKTYNVIKQTKKGQKVNTANLGKLIYDKHGPFFTIIDNKEIYQYNPNTGYYENTGEQHIRYLTEYYLTNVVCERHKNEVVRWIQDHNYKERLDIRVPAELINLRNGILNLLTGELLPHSPKYTFLNQLPLTYDINASFEKFGTYLKHISMKQGVVRKPIVDTIQEYLGYSLYANQIFKNYIVLDGGGDNGKTVLMNIVVALVGEKNNCSITLQELNDRPFARSQLFGKYTNVADDLPNKALKYTGVIKQITGNSPIWSDIKNSKKGISFYSYAKPWYSCNGLPETRDVTDAFFSRQLQITLLNKYLPKGDSQINGIDAFERNVNLTHELTTDEALSGILNYSLIGLKRLLQNKRFSDETTTETKRITWQRKTNPTFAFVEDEIETGDYNWAIICDDFFKEVVLFCERNGYDKPTSKTFVTQKINDLGLSIRKQRKTINGNMIWCYVGVKSTTNEAINHYVGDNATSRVTIAYKAENQPQTSLDIGDQEPIIDENSQDQQEKHRAYEKGENDE